MLLQQPARISEAGELPRHGEGDENVRGVSAMSLVGKIALVTGGSRGPGTATCLALADAGAKVIVNYASDETAVDGGPLMQ